VIVVITNNSLNIVDNTIQSSNISVSHKIIIKRFKGVKCSENDIKYSSATI
jgi:hypothetical protein